MVEELRKAWERFWALSWWWKGGAFGVTGFILLAIIASATGGGDDGPDDGTATPTPTPTVSATETVTLSATNSPTTTASPTPSASPTAEPTPPPTAAQTQAPTQPPTQAPTAAPTVTFTSIIGGPPNSNASATVQASPGASCSIRYTTPSGTVSGAAGLESKVADGNGIASWTWKIGGNTNPGTGSVSVTCNGVTVTSSIIIG